MSFGGRRIVPQHKPTAPPVNTMATYTLTPLEKAYAAAGRLDLIPTAEERGVKSESLPVREMKEPPPPDKFPTPGQRRTINITKEQLEQELAAGKKIVDIAKQYGATASGISSRIKKYGLKSNKPKRERWNAML